jgi:hypothetical protein
MEKILISDIPELWIATNSLSTINLPIVRSIANKKARGIVYSEILGTMK